MVKLVTDRVVAPNGKNIPFMKLHGGTPDNITIHETANTSVGANAMMHRNFVAGGGGYQGPDNPGVSFHWSVDSTQAVQIVSEDNATWNAADNLGPGNTDSWCCETCVNSDGNWEQTLHNLAQLVALKMKQYSIPIERVYQHNHWSGKDCPHFMRLNNNRDWNRLLDMIRVEFAQLNSPQPPPVPVPAVAEERTFSTGFKVRRPFLQFYDARGGLPVFGLPISDAEVRTVGNWQGVVQWFERARFELHPEIKADEVDQVLLGLVGVEAMKAEEGAK